MEKRSRIWFPVVWVCIVLAAGSLLVTTIYLNLRQQSVESREEQLLVLARSAASNLESYLGSYQKDFSVIKASSEFREGVEHFCATGDDALLLRYLDTYNYATEDYVADISLTDGEGRILAGTNRHGPYEAITAPGTDLLVSRNPQGRLYLAISTPVAEGLRMQSMVDVSYLYQSTGAFMTIGERGYVFYQHSGGVVIAHPRKTLAGVELTEGLRKECPEQDLDELAALAAQQRSGDEGIQRFRSCWWVGEEPQTAWKLAAYTPAQVGDDFIIVTAVADQGEIMALLNWGILLIGAVLSLMILALCLLTFQLYTAIREKSRVERENAYLRELNDRLEEMRRREEKLQHFQRLELIGTLTGGIAHELGNLLVPIMAYSAMMADQVTPQQEELYDEAQEIYSSAQKAKEVIQQITAISRRDRDTAFRRLDLVPTVESALKMALAAKPKEVELTWDLRLENCQVLGSATQLCQVILNLCTNAFHALAGREAGRLAVTGVLRTGKDGGEEAALTFADNGTGMEQQVLERIFDPFFTTKRAGEGTGLGLSIVQNIMENHHGTVTVESEAGKGSVFTVVIPAAPDLPAAG